MSAESTAAAPVAGSAIHDLGYKRYLGSRRPQATRWRVIVRNQVAVAWRGFWRMKAWVIAAAMTTVVFGALMYVARNTAFELFSVRATGSKSTFVDAMLPFSFHFYPWFAFVMTVSLAATVVPNDLKAGAFEFYFSRPVRPIDYVLGKFVGLFLVMAAVLAVGPFLLALNRVGITDPADMLATLVVIPKALLVGLLAAAAHAALPLACGALVGKPRNAIAVWTALYLVVGSIVAQVAIHLELPALVVLDPSVAARALAFDLFGVTDVTQRVAVASGWAGAAGLVGQTIVGLAVTWWRVVRAERAGLGGG